MKPMIFHYAAQYFPTGIGRIIVLAILVLAFFGCNKEDAADLYSGTYIGTMSFYADRQGSSVDTSFTDTILISLKSQESILQVDYHPVGADLMVLPPGGGGTWIITRESCSTASGSFSGYEPDKKRYREYLQGRYLDLKFNGENDVEFCNCSDASFQSTESSSIRFKGSKL